MQRFIRQGRNRGNRSVHRNRVTLLASQALEDVEKYWNRRRQYLNPYGHMQAQKITGYFNSSSLKFRYRLPIPLMFSQLSSIMRSWWLPSLSSWLVHKWIELISIVTLCRRGSNDAPKRRILKSDKKPPRRW
jgi:hypothetical protein